MNQNRTMSQRNKLEISQRLDELIEKLDTDLDDLLVCMFHVGEIKHREQVKVMLLSALERIK